jgi:hypothetical protein
MNKNKAKQFLCWLKQPSTIKAFVIFTTLIGCSIDPSKMEEIIT